MRGFIISTVVTAIAFFILVQLFPSMFGYDGGYLGLIVIAVVFGVVNGFVGPIVKTAALPVSFMTMGLVGFLINGGLLLLTAFITGQLGFQLTVGDFPPDLLTADTIVAAVVGAVVLSLISTVIRAVVPD
ncbi:MAG TPA: phage holin family protein [Candidatus Limnocylindrales bacterium]|nr:phage holin family protein [Candidatus Limnocylindrales bacterium]